MMKHPFRDLGLILGLAAFWAISGYVVGVSVELFLELLGLTPLTLTVMLASVNVIMGMLLFKGITHDPTAERIFLRDRRMMMKVTSGLAACGLSRLRCFCMASC